MAEHRGVPEHVRLQAPDIYCWHGRKMGRTIFDVHKGTLFVTDLRFVYVASGGTDVWRQLGRAGLGFVPGWVGNAAGFVDAGRTILGWFEDDLVRPTGQTLDLGPPEYLKDGSVVVPLTQLTEFGVVERRWSSYLWIAFVDHGQVREFAFSDKVRIPGGLAWEQVITEARARLTAP